MRPASKQNVFNRISCYKDNIVCAGHQYENYMRFVLKLCLFALCVRVLDRSIVFKYCIRPHSRFKVSMSLYKHYY